jgi:acetyl/propionyl-CoA carboxylase alpha subunit
VTRSVLIANRGEVALRIIRTCRRLGYRAIAVFSDADRDAAHVLAADDAVHIGPSPARESYLNEKRVLQAAHSSGADAIHPGYGFLAENAQFAAACARAGFRFVGPLPESIHLMADKVRARQIAQAAGVPVLPASPPLASELSQMSKLEELAAEVGYPLLIKPTAGGGGIGMRVVHGPEHLWDAYRAARALALHSFGDPAVYLEKFVPSSRHVEVQVFGLPDARVLHLYDRECSVQRRYQKVVEEAPAPLLPAGVRATLYASATKLAASIGYLGAGTVEFLVSRDGHFWFLEMNTRLQVEHGVTEMVTGIDLVAWQLWLAFDEHVRLPFDQSEVALKRNAAIEARIYAEDPASAFRPCPGRLTHLDVMSDDPLLRWDLGYRAGDLIPPYYDPLIGKAIASGSTREEARRRLLHALTTARVEGVATNLSLLRGILSDERFVRARLDTSFLETLVKSV